MSRQRLRSSISEANYQTCSFCSGTGNIRNVTSSALSFLRIVEEEALKENTEAIFAELPLDTATFILNEKRHELLQIESTLGTRIAVLPCADLHRPQYRLKRLRSEELDHSAATPSHELELEREDKDVPKTPMMQARQRPAVRLENLETSPPPEPAPDWVEPPSSEDSSACPQHGYSSNCYSVTSCRTTCTASSF